MTNTSITEFRHCMRVFMLITSAALLFVLQFASFIYFVFEIVLISRISYGTKYITCAGYSYAIQSVEGMGRSS